MRTFVLSLVAAFAVGGIAFAQSASPGPTPAASPTAPATPGATVHIKDFAFAPDSVTISAGQSVRFLDDDDTPHTVTADDKSFDSGNLNKGDKWIHAFTKAGTYKFVCTYHPYMKGTIVVK